MTASQIVASTLVVLGCVVVASGALGLFRFSNLFARMHVATKPTTLGVTLCLLGALIAVDDAGSKAKLGVAIAFQLIGAPTGAHALARASKRAGMPAEGDLDDREVRR